MQALFVHGMGRSSRSGWPLLRRLRLSGMTTATFDYRASRESFEVIRDRLVEAIREVASRDDYVLIGHSLGGVLARAALQRLPLGIRPPNHLFLLGSPILASRMAQRFVGNPIYRRLTRDCGQLLGSTERMTVIGQIAIPTTVIAGDIGPRWAYGPFRGECNDGLVALSEVSEEWLPTPITVPVYHTLLPFSRRVADIILDALKAP